MLHIDVGTNNINRNKRNRKNKTKQVSPFFSSSRTKVKQKSDKNSDDNFGAKLSKSRGKIRNQNRKRKGDNNTPKSWSSVSVTHDEISHTTTTIHDNNSHHTPTTTTTSKPHQRFQQNNFPRTRQNIIEKPPSSSLHREEQKSEKSSYKSKPKFTSEYVTNFTPVPVTAVPALTTPDYYNHYIPPAKPTTCITNSINIFPTFLDIYVYICLCVLHVCSKHH